MNQWVINLIGHLMLTNFWNLGVPYFQRKPYSLYRAAQRALAYSSGERPLAVTLNDQALTNSAMVLSDSSMSVSLRLFMTA